MDIESKSIAKEFLEALYGDYLSKHSGYVEIRAIRDGRALKREFYRTIEGLLDSLDEGLINACNIYFGVAPREEKKGSKDAIQHITSFWVDIDAGITGHKKAGEFKNKDQALKNLNGYRIKPSIVIDSGNGLHCYWLLRESIDVTSCRLRAEFILNGLIKDLGGDPGTGDITRILRLPATKNNKDLSAPKQVKMIYIDSSIRYGLDDFKELEQLGEKEIVSTDISDFKISGDTPDIDFPYLQSKFIAPTILAIIRDGDNSGEYLSRSERDQAVITELLVKNFTNDEIRGVFNNPEYSISDKYLEQGRYRDLYLARSIRNAASFVERQLIKVSETHAHGKGISIPADARKFIDRFLEENAPIFPWEMEGEYKEFNTDNCLIYRKEIQIGKNKEIQEYIIQKGIVDPSKKIPLKEMKEAYLTTYLLGRQNHTSIVEFTIQDKLPFLGTKDISGKKRAKRERAEEFLANTQYRLISKTRRSYQQLYAGLQIDMRGKSKKYIATLNPTFLPGLDFETGRITGQYTHIQLPLKLKYQDEQSYDRYERRALRYFLSLGRKSGRGLKILPLSVEKLFKEILMVPAWEIKRPKNCQNIWEKIMPTIKKAGHKLIDIEVKNAKDKEQKRILKYLLRIELREN